MDIKNREVMFFRAHIDPGVHAMPKNAVHMNDVKKMELTPQGIYVMNNGGFEFIVPYANCQTIKLKPIEAEKEKAK